MCQQKGTRAFGARREQIDNKDLVPFQVLLVVSAVVRTSYNSPHSAT